MRLAFLLPVLTAGCTPSPGLVFSPASLAFGEVDFEGELPDEGYAVLTTVLRNAGKTTIAISLPEYDTDRLCLGGFDTQVFPFDLGPLNPGAAYTFQVGVCGYVSGEAGTEVATELRVDGEDETASLPITFTPMRSSG